MHELGGRNNGDIAERRIDFVRDEQERSTRKIIGIFLSLQQPGNWLRSAALPNFEPIATAPISGRKGLHPSPGHISDVKA